MRIGILLGMRFLFIYLCYHIVCRYSLSLFQALLYTYPYYVTIYTCHSSNFHLAAFHIMPIVYTTLLYSRHKDGNVRCRCKMCDVYVFANQLVATGYGYGYGCGYNLQPLTQIKPSFSSFIIYCLLSALCFLLLLLQSDRPELCSTRVFGQPTRNVANGKLTIRGCP